MLEQNRVIWFETDETGCNWVHHRRNSYRHGPDSPSIPDTPYIPVKTGDSYKTCFKIGDTVAKYNEHWKRLKYDEKFPAKSSIRVSQDDTGERYEYVCHISVESVEDQKLTGDNGFVHIVDPTDFTVHRLRRIATM
jgi:hypothetical protein